MAPTVDARSMLAPEQLREIDQHLLSYLRERAVTPQYCRARLSADGVDDYSRGYVQQRLKRLEEHDHAENLLGVGLYELVDDPERAVEPAEAMAEADTDDDPSAIYDCPECEWTGDDWGAFQDHRETHEE